MNLPISPWITRALVALAIALTAVFGAREATAATIVNEPFGVGWTAGTTWVAGGNYTPDIYTDNAFNPTTALRLTWGDNANSSQYRSKTAALSYSIPQPTSGGLDVRFILAEWGGTGGTVDGADGITFFIRKGSDPANSAGSSGGALAYAPNVGLSIPGMPGGLIGVGFDMQGNYPDYRVSGTGCTNEPGGNITNTPDNITIRGPGQGTSGYCRLAYTTTGVSLGGGTESRAGRARSIRVTVDPATAANPRVKVYYGGDGSGTVGASPKLDVAVPAEFLAEETFKFGFGAATGSITNNNEVWGLTVDSLVELPPIEITTPSLPNGTVNTAYSCTLVETSNGVAPVSFELASGSLPPGLTLNPATGEVCGTPTEPGTFSFTVRATDSRGPTVSTTTKAYTIEVSESRPPCAPVDLGAAAGAESAALRWAPNLGAGCGVPTKYEVEASSGEKCTVDAPKTTCDIKGLPPGTPVKFRVRAINGAGTSAWSSYTEEITPKGEIEIVGTPSVTNPALIVRVETARAGRIVVTGRSRVSKKWVTRCMGRASAPSAITLRVTCAFTPAARKALCKRSLTIRLTADLVAPDTKTKATTTTLTVPKRWCKADFPVVG